VQDEGEAPAGAVIDGTVVSTDTDTGTDTGTGTGTDTGTESDAEPQPVAAGFGPPPVPLPDHAVAGRAPLLSAKGLDAPARPSRLQYSAPTIDGDESDNVQRSLSNGPSSSIASGGKAPGAGQAVGSEPARNQPCPCGSGKKYKRCHGAPGSAPLG